MKRLALLLLFAISSIVGAQTSTVIKGELSPGVYANYLAPKVSVLNSTIVNLGAGAVFTGTSEDVLGYADIRVSVFSSHASATDGLQLQQSSNGTVWDNVDAYTIPAATGKNFSVAPGSQFFRLVYTNGATLTTTLRITTIYRNMYAKPTSVRPQDARPNDQDMEEILSYNMGYDTTANTWSRLRNYDGAMLTKAFANATSDWQYAAASGGIINTTDVVIKATAGGLRNYVTGIACQNGNAVATEVVLKDGATVIWRAYLGAVTTPASEVAVVFPTPLRGTAGTAVNLAAITTAAAVYCNVQGYSGV